MILYSNFNRTFKGDKILNIYQDTDGDEWVMTNKGINIIGKKQIESDFPFRKVIESNKHIYLISTSGKACHLYSIKWQDQIYGNPLPDR